MMRALQPCRVAAGALGLLAAACAPKSPPVWLLNETSSVPRGLYRLTVSGPGARVQAGDVVAVRPPVSARAYLEDLGAPRDARLLKRVVAGPGETVCRRGQRLSWPKRAVTALAGDRRGRTLPRWGGCRRLGPDERLVVGDTWSSFDSRYFGPVTTADIEGVYKEVWRW